MAFISQEDGFANALAVYNHIDTEKDDYVARFRVIPESFPSPKGSDFIYVGGVVVAQVVYFVWRNAVSEKV